MNDIIYPDSGSKFEDASILRNAVYFCTNERAYSAQLILQQPLNVNKLTLSFLIVKAFEEFMTSTEDLIGWLFALQQWQPGNAEFCLLLLLDRITVGRGEYKEDKAVSLLSGLDSDSFRGLCHIPNDRELIDSGMSEELVLRVGQSMPKKLQGWLEIAKRRTEEDRGWVKMFNKLKHHMIALPTKERGKDEIWLPTHIKFDKKNNRIFMGNGWIEVSTKMLRRFAGDAIGAQAILHDTLATILISRFNENYQIPRWVIDAYNTDYIWNN